MSSNLPHPTEAIDDHWEIYGTYVDERPAVILVDVGISGSVPLPGLSKLVWLWVYLKSPDVQGFAEDDEDLKLTDIEDAVAEALQGIGTKYVGRIATDGRREFYFYVNHIQPFHEIVTKVLEDSSDYQFEIDEMDDPNWNHYQDVLFPTPEDLLELQNQRAIAKLDEDGDRLTTPRPVDQFASFMSEQDREAFIAAAASLGFEAVSRPIREETDYPFSVGLLRVHAVDLETIDQITFDLFDLAQEHDGQYDGWSSRTVK